MDLEYDYKYDNHTVIINKNQDFTIDGNCHSIEGITGFDVFIFNSTKTITLNNMTFRNCTDTQFKFRSPVVFKNVSFIDCSCINQISQTETNGFLYVDSNVTINDCVFQMKTGRYSPIYTESGTGLFINNSIFNGGDFLDGYIYANRCDLVVENSTFSDFSARLATTINFKGWNLTIKNSRFINLNSSLSGGAIIIKYFPNIIYDKNRKILPNDEFIIEDCEFINTSCINDGGAIHFDMDSGSQHRTQTLILTNNNFTD